MSIWEAVILGVVQGLTEFLPVSSSGHLTLGKAILGITEKGILFEVVVHLGTLLAVFTEFSKDIVWLLKGMVAFITPKKRDPFAPQKDDGAIRYITYIIWATIPAVIVGLFFKDTIEGAFANPVIACFLLLVTGIILLLSRIGLKADGQVTLSRSVIIGVAQALAIFPGISRSGSTIATGMLLGVQREEAARFSFLMAIPAIAGAFVLQLKDIMEQPPESAFVLALVVGFIASYISGYAAIKVLMSLVRRGRFDYFAWYCFAVGIVGLIYFYG